MRDLIEGLADSGVVSAHCDGWSRAGVEGSLSWGSFNRGAMSVFTIVTICNRKLRGSESVNARDWRAGSVCQPSRAVKW